MNGKISATLLSVPPSELRENAECHCDSLRQRFLVIICDLVPYDLKVIPCNFCGNMRVILEDTAFSVCNVIYETPCMYLDNMYYGFRIT